MSDHSSRTATGEEVRQEVEGFRDLGKGPTVRKEDVDDHGLAFEYDGKEEVSEEAKGLPKEEKL